MCLPPKKCGGKGGKRGQLQSYVQLEMSMATLSTVVEEAIAL